MGCGTWAWGNQLLWGYNRSMDEELQQVFLTTASARASPCSTRAILTAQGVSMAAAKPCWDSLLMPIAVLIKKYLHCHQAGGLPLAVDQRFYRQSLRKGSARRLGRPVDLAQMHWSTANYAPWQEGPFLDGLMDLSRTGPGEGRRAFQLWAETAEVVIQAIQRAGHSHCLPCRLQYSLVIPPTR